MNYYCPRILTSTFECLAYIMDEQVLKSKKRKLEMWFRVRLSLFFGTNVITLEYFINNSKVPMYWDKNKKMKLHQKLEDRKSVV